MGAHLESHKNDQMLVFGLMSKYFAMTLCILFCIVLRSTGLLN